MDARQFDTVVKALGTGTHRRRVLQGLLAVGAGLGLGRGAALETNAAGKTQTATLYLTTEIDIGCNGDLATPPETRGQVNYAFKTGLVSATVLLRGAEPNATYTVSQRCVGPLGEIKTNRAGGGKNTFTYTDSGDSRSGVDMDAGASSKIGSGPFLRP